MLGSPLKALTTKLEGKFFGGQLFYPLYVLFGWRGMQIFQEDGNL